ncbi:MAG TPA: class I tRNA ligase family protein, partial [Candidatus Dormibacteraeota bacterium]|nr:class I tRNA ligase family protein [Candidatus Dormibacteraeota bacterium]
KFIGQHVLRPLPAEYSPAQKRIPIIGDDQVDFEFGTGVLKVTPAHDKADFEIGLRHRLPQVDIMNPDATMNDLAGQDLRGLDRFKARKAAVEKLTALGALEKEQPYTHNVGFSERADVAIEPRLSEQWFLKYPSAVASRQVVAQGRMKFFPERWAKVYDHWMEHLQDWCISRQLWWGHRIPVWYRKGHAPSAAPGAPDAVLSAQSAGANANVYVGVEPPPDPQNWEQDPDVLDTWFSSWLWPFATMGWPQQNETLRTFYPTTDLVTAPDIIFFWVARMIMAGYEYMGEMPFRNVYYTGIIRDKNGVKMQKSLGNSPDPLALIQGYGADALRFGIMRSVPLGQDLVFEDREFERYGKERYDFANIPWNPSRFPQLELARNFCNKLWNACRFRQMQGGEVQGDIQTNRLRSDDKWILLKLHQCIKDLNTAFAEYRFSDATKTLYEFFWTDYCDYYVEATKAVFQGTDVVQKANTLAVIDFVLSHALRLFHPFLPFITEELWHGMGYAEDMPADQGGRSIMHAPWPKPFDADTRDFYSLDDCYLEFVDAKIELISKGRNLRKESKIPDNRKARFVLKPAQDLPPNDIEVIRTLLYAETVQIDPDYQPRKGVASTKAGLGELYL